MPYLAIGGAGMLAGFILGKGASGASGIVKWGVIGGGVYFGAKYLKVI